MSLFSLITKAHAQITIGWPTGFEPTETPRSKLLHFIIFRGTILSIILMTIGLVFVIFGYWKRRSLAKEARKRKELALIIVGILILLLGLLIYAANT